MNNDELFSLERLEHFAYTRQSEPAAREMLKLLTHLDSHMGQLGDMGTMPSGQFSADQRDAHFATRIASAVTALFSDPAFELSDLGFQQLIYLQRWMTMLFGASPFGNADHIIHLMNQRGYAQRAEITINSRDYFRLCLLYSLDSAIPLQPEAIWNENKRLAASLFLAMLSARIVVSDQAHAKKEYLLGWLPERLRELSLDDFPIGILHDVWMHCSYADRPDKHRIKRAINELIRIKLLAIGFADVAGPVPPGREKPVLMCILEWFNANHSIYRTHSVSMEALKAKYHLVGVSLEEASDDITRKVFDEVHVIPRTIGLLEKLQAVVKLAQTLRPDVLYYPSVGMFPQTVFLVNLRLAPIQLVALGHPATTHSQAVDYVMVENDYIGDPACFAEKLVALPKDAIPYRPPANCPKIEPKIRTAPEVVKIAVAAAVMKLNPGFLRTLGQIAQRSKLPVEFHLFTGFAFGLGKVYLQNLILGYLPTGAVLYPHLQYDAYLENINRCDMFVNPFPFGNTNGIVDTVRQGLPGVCLTGAEVHTHIDEGLFKRLGLPDWLVAHTLEEYVSAAVRLAEDHQLRGDLSRQIQKTDPDSVLFQGNGEPFLHAVEWLRANHAELSASPERLLKPPAVQGPAPSAAAGAMAAARRKVLGVAKRARDK